MTVQSDEPIDGGSAVSLRDHLSLWIKRVEQSFADRLETVERVNTERDARYNERFMAAQTLVDQNSASSEKAILKAETAQRIYDSGHNDLLAKMDKQQQLSMPRGETEAKIAAVVLAASISVLSFASLAVRRARLCWRRRFCDRERPSKVGSESTVEPRIF